MKTYKMLLVIFFVLTCISFAQEKDESIAMPVGGMEAVMKNVKYPADAKKDGIEGKVYIKAVIDEEGKVISAVPEKEANKLLVEASITAIKNTKFNPAKKDGKGVKSEVVIPIAFKLK